MSAVYPGESVRMPRAVHVGDMVAAATALRAEGLVPDGLWYDAGRSYTRGTSFATVDCQAPDGTRRPVEAHFTGGEFTGFTPL